MATNGDNTLTIEPYKLSEIFSIVPEFDGNPMFLQTFITACTHAQGMAVEDQRILLTLDIKNRLRGKAAELINSRNPATWAEINSLLEAHFGDSGDLTALIQDLQRIYQLHNENALTFVSRLQTHNAKMHAAVQKTDFNARGENCSITFNRDNDTEYITDWTRTKTRPNHSSR